MEKDYFNLVSKLTTFIGIWRQIVVGIGRQSVVDGCGEYVCLCIYVCILSFDLAYTLSSTKFAF